MFYWKKDCLLLIYDNFIAKKNKQTNKQKQYYNDNINAYIFFNDHRENDINTVRLKTHDLFGRLVFVFIFVLCFVLFFFIRRMKLKTSLAIRIGRKIVFTRKSSLANLIGCNALECENLEHKLF